MSKRGLAAMDPEKAYKLLGWSPQVNFNSLVRLMVESEVKGKEVRI